MACRTIRAISITLSLLLVASAVSAQDAPPKHGVRPKHLGPAKWEPSQQQISAAYWTLEPGWNTDIEIRNNVESRELTVTPVINLSSGKEFPLSPVTVAARHVISLDLRSLVESDSQLHEAVGSFGSISFRYQSLHAGNVFAAAMVHREGAPIDFHFDASAVGTQLYPTAGLEGVWWVPAQSSTTYLILSNPSRKVVTGSLAFSMLSKNRRVPLRLEPGQTMRIDVREMLGSSSVGMLGGLTIALPNHQSVGAAEIIFDEITGLTAIMKLFDRDPDERVATHSLLAPMMALSQPDRSLALPSGTTLLPRVFLRNASAGPAEVSLSVDWRNASKSGQSVLPQLTLSPGEVRIVDLADQQSAAHTPADANWGTVKLSYVGRQADVVAVALSYDKTGRYGLQTPFSEGLSRLWVGTMWHVDATHNTLITTGNVGTESTTAEVTLFYNQGKGKYRIEKMLAPGKQMWLDVGEIVRNQVPDSDGNVLPADTMNGSYELRDLDHGTIGQLYEGKLVIDKTYGHASYGCGSCCGYSNVALDPNPFAGPPGINNNDSIWGTEECGGGLEDLTDTGYNWNSNNTAVATLASAALHTVAVGSATGAVKATVQGDRMPMCPQQTWNPTQPVSVCPTPTSELSSIQGRAYVEIPGGQTVTRFQQTVSDGAQDVFNGDSVTEASGYAGTNGCYYPGAPFPPTSTVTGGTWTIGQNNGFAVNGTNQWGFDYDGDAASLVTTIRQHASLPCVDNVPQTMYIATSCATPIPYYSNVQTVTISATTVSNCRGGVCDTFTY